MAAFSWPLSRQIVVDANGDPVPGAKLNFFVSGTTTPLAVYSDAELAVPLTDPVVADANGRWPRVFMEYTDYRERVRTPAGTLLWDDDGIATPPAPATVDPDIPDSELNKTGAIRPAFEEGVIEGYVRLNGRTIGNATSGATERADADTADLYAYLWDRLSDTLAPVSTGRGASAAADYAAGKTLSLPDWRGRAPFGVDDMGASPASRLNGATISAGTATTPGSVGGAAVTVLAQANLPAVSPTITVSDTSQKSFTFGGTTIAVGAGAPQTVVTDITTTGNPTTVQTTLTTTGAVSATIAALGSGNAFSSISPFALVAWHIKL